METIIKGLADLLLVGGTVGGYAMITIILLIVGYFKYFKPFLVDFYTMKKVIEEEFEDHKRIMTKIDQILRDIEKNGENVLKETKGVSSELQTDHRALQTELVNILNNLVRDVAYNIDSKTGDAKNRIEENHREIMIELTKLQSKMDYGYNSYSNGMKGLQK